jgi:2-(1,2-epoxy-1,2-dihydrophenyl)acetyl-CoA isomerase
MSDVLLKERSDGILTLTLNRPERLNALNPPLMRALVEAANAAAVDPEVRVVVLRGAGRGFCAGGDIGRMGDRAGEPDPTEREAARATETFEGRVRWLRNNMDVVRVLHDMPKPTIAMIHGAAAGAGLALACSCDVRIVSADASFLTAFIKVGFSGDYGGSYFLTRLLGTAKARELYFLGDKIDANEALRVGLVNRVVAREALEEETTALARRIAQGPSVAYAYMKRTLNTAEHARLEEILDLEALNQTLTGLTEDHREAARAFMEKRPPVYKGK